MLKKPRNSKCKMVESFETFHLFEIDNDVRESTILVARNVDLRLILSQQSEVTKSSEAQTPCKQGNFTYRLQIQTDIRNNSSFPWTFYYKYRNYRNFKAQPEATHLHSNTTHLHSESFEGVALNLFWSSRVKSPYFTVWIPLTRFATCFRCRIGGGVVTKEDRQTFQDCRRCWAKVLSKVNQVFYDRFPVYLSNSLGDHRTYTVLRYSTDL